MKGAGRDGRFGLVQDEGLERALQLVHAERALDARGDLAVFVDDEEPGLGGQPVLLHLRTEVLGPRLVVDVDLLVDERGCVAVLRLDLLGHVHDGAADAALAERRRGEEEDDGLLAQDVRQIVAVHRARGLARVDGLDVAAHLGEGGRVHLRRGLADVGDLLVLLDDHAGVHRGGDHAVGPVDHGGEPPFARLVERDVGDVDDLGVVLGGRLGDELGLGFQALDAGGERPKRLARGAVGCVDGDLGVGDLGPADVEEAEPEALVAGLEDGTGWLATTWSVAPTSAIRSSRVPLGLGGELPGGRR